jgi:hypothetical protein
VEVFRRLRKAVGSGPLALLSRLPLISHLLMPFLSATVSISRAHGPLHAGELFNQSPDPCHR